MSEQWLSVVLLMMPFGVILADWLFGLPNRCHPLNYLDQLARALAARVNKPENGPAQQRLAGRLMAYMFIGALLISYWGFSTLADIPLFLQALALFILLDWRALFSDLHQVTDRLAKHQEPLARLQLSHRVLRDTHQLTPVQMTQAASESLILNLAHHWFATLFWYALMGIYGALAYRLIAMLAQSWNRKLDTYRQFGQGVDTLKHMLCWPSDLLLALLMCCVGNFHENYRAYQQGFRWPRLHSGRLLAVSASWVNSELGGQRSYHGDIHSFALLGKKNHPILFHDFKLLTQRCYIIAIFYLLLVFYPLLLCRYLFLGL